ncbi:MAG: PDZ domain-containing protein [Phycisphaerales bacterium]
MPRRDGEMSARARLVMLGLLVGSSWGGVAAEPALGSAFVPEELAAVRELLPGLESVDFTARENATRQLCESPKIGLDAIGAALAEPGVTPEQAQRLIAAYKRKFLLTPRPALGIGLGMAPDDDRGIAVSEVIGGLPAVDGGLIQWGDIIVSLDGAATVTTPPTLSPDVRYQLAQDRAISLIQSYAPGETVVLEILRLKDRLAPFRRADGAANPAQAGGAAGEPGRPEGGPDDAAKEEADHIAEVIAPRPTREHVTLLKRSMERERVLVRAPLGSYARLANRGQGGFIGDPEVQIGGVVAQRPQFSGLLARYGDTAMEARLNRQGVKWPGGTPFSTASRISQGHEVPPPAYTARIALGLDGAGHDPSVFDPSAYAARDGLVFQGIDQAGRQIFRAGNGIVVMPGGLDMQVRRARGGAQGGLAMGQRIRGGGPGLRPIPAPAAAEVVIDPTSPSGGPGGAGGAGDESSGRELVGVTVDPAVTRGLNRLAALTSELARAERRAADASLDPPTQREAEKRAADLREAVSAMIDAVSKGQAGGAGGFGVPTVEVDGDNTPGR